MWVPQCEQVAVDMYMATCMESVDGPLLAPRATRWIAQSLKWRIYAAYLL